LPNELRFKDENQLAYYKKYGRQLLADYTQRELKQKERVVLENAEWVVVVPFWAEWPFETMLLPKTPVQRITDLSEIQKNSLAEMIKSLTVRYDNLFNTLCPYSMGWHGKLHSKNSLYPAH